MSISRVLALSLLSAATAAAAFGQTSHNPPAIQSLRAPGVIFEPSGAACTGGVQVDDGTFESGYYVSGSSSQIVQRLTPQELPALLTRACICWIAGDASATSLSYNLVVYDDNGPGGQPGTLLGSRAVSATGISSTAPTFFGYDCSVLDVGVTSGSIYVGASWNQIANPSMFLCADESTTTPAAGIYGSDDGGSHWTRFQEVEDRARAVGVRAEFFGNGCIPDDFTLCLHNGRFAVQATYETPDGTSGAAKVVKLTDQTGYLWFFDPANVEAVVKVLDGCALNDRFWVFAGGLTNVRTVITVTDKLKNNTKIYVNPQGRAFKPVQDTNAFATCGG
ncbi:MAG TPA: hypothetical protein VEW48_01510 [Thermoanaerobaculia bacterium]|nr:hypothetical protein [Thermoanaerobaculia bacterium]